MRPPAALRGAAGCFCKGTERGLLSLCPPQPNSPLLAPLPNSSLFGGRMEGGGGPRRLRRGSRSGFRRCRCAIGSPPPPAQLFEGGPTAPRVPPHPTHPHLLRDLQSAALCSSSLDAGTPRCWRPRPSSLLLSPRVFFGGVFVWALVMHTHTQVKEGRWKQQEQEQQHAKAGIERRAVRVSRGTLCLCIWGGGFVIAMREGMYSTRCGCRPSLSRAPQVGAHVLTNTS